MQTFTSKQTFIAGKFASDQTAYCSLNRDKRMEIFSATNVMICVERNNCVSTYTPIKELWEIVLICRVLHEAFNLSFLFLLPIYTTHATLQTSFFYMTSWKHKTRLVYTMLSIKL